MVAVKLEVLAEYMVNHVDKGFFGRNGSLSQCALHSVATIDVVLSKDHGSEEIEPMLQ